MNVNRIWGVGSWIGLLPLGLAVLSVPVFAQIVPDNTLGTESSQVTPNVDIRGLPGERIDGGATRGSALFHSFSEFNVNDGQRVYFSNPTGIDNILTRVTGANVSNILGTLGVDGGANLFLLNPNGILFGSNAQLDIGGSFFASTARGFQFADGSEFSATNPQAAPLLTMSVTPGVQYGTQPLGEIKNAGNLAVGSGQTLALHGGDVTSTGSLSAPEGTVMILGDRIGLLDNARINVSSQTGGGTVLIGGGLQGKGAVPNATRTFVDAGVQIEADALTTGDGGNVIVWADEVTGFYGNISARGGIEAGNGGFVEVSGKEHLIFRGAVDTSAANGIDGTLLLDPVNITIANGTGDAGADGNNTFTGDNSGSVGSIFSTPLSQFDNAPTTIYESELEGLAGSTNIVLQATNNITIQNLADNALVFQPGSGRIALTADADRNGVGSFLMQDVQDTLYTNGRNIEISGASLTLGNINTSFSNGGEVSLSAQGDLTVGNIEANGLLASGNITLTTKGTVSINNSKIESLTKGSETGGEINITADIVEILDGGLIASGTGGSGDAGNVIINTRRLLIQNSQPDSNQITAIRTGTGLGVSGDGGDIFIYASELVELIGNQPGEFIPDLTNPDAVFQAKTILVGLTTTSFGSGKAGNLIIETEQFTIQDGAGASAAALGTESNAGAGGEIRVSADIIEFQGLAGLATTTLGPGEAGDLIVNANNITLRDGASILADAVGDPDIVRQAGNISITAQTLLLDNRSRLSATTQTGDGGNIQLQNLTSLHLRDHSEISASTQTGRAGSVNLSQAENPVASVTLNNSRISAQATREGGNAGSVTLNTSQLTLENGAEISASNVSGTSKNITLQGLTSLSLSDRSKISASTQTGQAGSVSVNDEENPAASVTLNNSSVSAQANEAGGNAGDVTLFTSQLTLKNQAQVSASNVSSTTGGNIDLQELQTLQVSDSLISTSTQSGKAGSVTVEPTQSVNLSGTLPADAQGVRRGGILAEATNGGSAGDVKITTGQLSIRDTAAVAVSSTGAGTAGKLTVSAPEVILENSAKLAATTQAGSGGDIQLQNLSSLQLNNGTEISASTESGTGGNVSVEASGGTVALTGNSHIKSEANGGQAGNLDITANQLTLRDSSSATVSSTDQGTAGSLTVNAPSVVLDNQAMLTATTQAGSGGNIQLQNLSSLQVSNNSEISASTQSGKGGSMSVNAPGGTVALTGNSRLEAEATQGGQAGNLQITANQLTLQDTSSATVSSTGAGTAGKLTVSAPEVILENSSRLAATTQAGSGGDIQLQNLSSLQLRNSSEISASTQSGKGGSLSVNAPGGTVALTDNSSLKAEATQGGNAGNVTINTHQLSLQDNSQVATSSQNGSGTAGDVNITASRLTLNQGGKITAQTDAGGSTNPADITLQGLNTLQLRGNSEISASTNKGQAGSITINTPNNPAASVTLNNSRLSVQANANGGNAGSITINTNSLALRNRSQIIADTKGNQQGANITLQGLDWLILRNGSLISANAGETANGGNITIDADFIIAVPNENSDITANASQGNGGNINITTQGMFGIKFRLKPTLFSDITASSESGLTGTVAISTPNVDPSQGLTALPIDLIDPSNQITRSCGASASRQNQFVVTGRGGLPPSPDDLQTSGAITPGWVTRESNTTNQRAAAVEPPTTAATTPLVEAQGMTINAQGELVLTAQAATTTPHQSGFPDKFCSPPNN